MLEIILMYLLGRKIARLAREQGRNPTGAVVMMVALWFVCEIAGGIVATIICTAMEIPPSFLAVWFGGILGAAFGGSLAFVLARGVAELNRTQAVSFGALMLYASVMLAIAGYLGYLAYQADSIDRLNYYPFFFWCAANFVIGVGTALWALTLKPGADSSQDETSLVKVLVLAVGGLLGLATVACLGIGYVYLWWDDLTKSRAAWGEPKTWTPVLIILGGLAVMLFSVLAVRSEERKNVTLRRLIYGYNAVLVGLLVFAILGVGNVMASIYAMRPFDWTETNIYSISDTSKQILERLDVPTKVFVLIRPSDPLFEDMKTLLDTCQTYSSKLEVEYALTSREAARVMEKYELLDDSPVVVVYDPEETQGKARQQAIKSNELEEFESRRMSEERQRSFKGERAVVSAIQSLREGKITRTLYFTQDSGEMKLGDYGGGRTRPGTLDRGLGSLRDKLQKGGYTVKELSLGQINPETREPAKVPDDAFAVVIAGPADLGEPTVAATKLKVLQEYMKRKDGRLVMLFEARRNRDGVVQPTGFEDFLAGFGVQMGKDIILHPPFDLQPDPTAAIVALAAAADRSFQESFVRTSPFSLHDCRTIKPGGPGGGFNVQSLLETAAILGPNVTGQWPEENLAGDPEAHIQKLMSNREAITAKMRATAPVSVAVTVRDKASDSALPDDPVHAPMRQGEGQPRMVIFGSTTLATNTATNGREIYYNLFGGSLGWLKGREGEVLTAIEPKERKAYRMNLKPEDRNRILWVPGLVLLIGVIGCGIGVWFLRRG